MNLLCNSVLLLAAALLCCTRGVAQSACPCSQSFDFAVEKIRLIYAGYQDKVNASTRAAFHQHTQAQRQKAALATTEDECFQVLREWTNWFKDRHTGVSLSYSLNTSETDPVKLRALFAGTEKISMTEKEARAYLDKNKRKLDPVEGIYEAGVYRVAIIKSTKAGRDFAGFILKADSVWWMPGQVKMELKKEADGYATQFYMKDHARQQHKSQLAGNQLKVGDLAVYNKVYPAAAGASAATPPKAAGSFSMEELSPQTMLLTLPSFDHTHKRVVDSLLRTNRNKLLSHPNFIIDVRNNGGGSDITYYGLAPYLYTNPIISVSSAIWSSEDNISKFQQLLDDPGYPGDKEYFRKLISRMQAGLGTFIDRSNDTLTLDSVYANPRRVAVLVNRKCGSSCEQFVLAAKESRKVVVYGENTAGVLDYANVHSLRMPCGNLSLYYATSRTKRLPHYPIDNIGIAPDVRVGEEIPDLVPHVQRLLESGK